MTDKGTRSPPQRRLRWGLRTMGFLALAALAVVTAMIQGHHTVGTLGSLTFGLLGAAYCSVKGLREARERGMYGLLMDRRRK